MKDKLFDEALMLLKRLESQIDRAIEIMHDADLDTPFGRQAKTVDPTIRRLTEIVLDLRASRDEALSFLER